MTHSSFVIVFGLGCAAACTEPATSAVEQDIGAGQVQICRDTDSLAVGLSIVGAAAFPPVSTVELVAVYSSDTYWTQTVAAATSDCSGNVSLGGTFGLSGDGVSFEEAYLLEPATGAQVDLVPLPAPGTCTTIDLVAVSGACGGGGSVYGGGHANHNLI